MKLPNIGINQAMLPTIAVGAIIGLALYSMLNKKTAVMSSAYGRAANQFFSGEVNYYPNASTPTDSYYGADATGETYLTSNTVPTSTSYPPSPVYTGINAIWRENLETLR